MKVRYPLSTIFIAIFILNAACSHIFIYVYLIRASKTVHGTGIPPSPTSVQTPPFSYVQPLPPPDVQPYPFDIQTLPLLNKNVNKQLPLHIPSQENNIPFMNLQKGFL